MNETQPAPLVDLSLEIESSPETVWGILTTPDLFSAWMDGKVEFEARTGSPFRAEFPNIQTVIAGEIVALDADARHLGLTWGMESGPGAEAFPAGCSLVEFRVHDADAGCRVELRHSSCHRRRSPKPTKGAGRSTSAGWLCMRTVPTSRRVSSGRSPVGFRRGASQTK